MFQEQLDNLLKEFQLSRGTYLKLYTEKCQLYQKEVRYPGNASPEGVTTDPQKLEAVQR
jgi:hypothetical protein